MDDPQDQGALSAVRRDTAVRLMDSIRRGMDGAEAAEGHSAAGEKAAALKAFHQAQAQYRASLELLLLSDDLTAAQREDAQLQLASLFDRLARFCSDIGDIGRGGDSQDSGESAEHEPTPEILSVAMMAAGQQLIEALNQEREQGSRSSSEEDPLVAAAHWQEARKRVELARQEYDAALRRYRDAMLQSPEPPQRTVPRRTMLVLEDAPAVAGCIPKESRS